MYNNPALMRHIVGYDKTVKSDVNSTKTVNSTSFLNIILKMFEKKNEFIQRTLSYQ